MGSAKVFAPRFANWELPRIALLPCFFLLPVLAAPRQNRRSDASTLPTMNRIRTLGLVLGTVAFGATVAFGQASAPAPATNTDETAVKLDPFTVNADSDVGFVASTSLAGGRMATALKDTPIAYSVVTKEFLDAFNITDVTEATQWTPNSNFTLGDNTEQGFVFTPATNVRIRGVKVGLPTRNFFPYLWSGDAYNLDRVDAARGANAILFGAGSYGGSNNTGTKQANPARSFQEVKLQVGSFSRYRFTADINQAVNTKLAVRANLLWQENRTWRAHEWEKRNGLHLAATYKFTPNFSVRAEGEYLKTLRLQALAQLKDNLSGWDGRTYHFNAPLTGAGAPSAAQQAQWGIGRIPSRFTTHPSFGNVVMNFQNQFRTVGAQHNATATNYVNGQPIRTVGFAFRNQAMIDLQTGIPDLQRYGPSLAGSPYFNLPTREENPLWDSNDQTWTEFGRDASLIFNYNAGRSLFLEFGGNINRSPKRGDNSARRGMYDTYIDISRDLPNGTPNPNFLHRYSEYMDYFTDKMDGFESIRAQGVYMRDTRLGKIQLSAMGGQNWQVADAYSSMLILPLTHLAPDARTWVDGSEQSEYGYWNRRYHDDVNRPYFNSTSAVAIDDPVTGVRTSVIPRWVYDTRRQDNSLSVKRQYRYLQGGGNLDLFKNRLVLIAAVRRDWTSMSQDRVISTGDNAPGWDGRAQVYRPNAPGDYFALTYYPKSATGAITGPLSPAETRPRVNVGGVNVGAPQYVNDRFRDDFDSPNIKNDVTKYSVGAVVNVNRWLGLYANRSTSYDLNIGSQNATLSVLPPTAAISLDAGVRVTLPNGKLAASLGWYNSYQDGAIVGAPSGFTAAYNAIYDAPVVGDLTAAGRNNRGVARLGSVSSTRTNDTRGYELETTANITSSWRLILNAGYTDANAMNAYPDIIEYFAAQDAISRQILGDAGIVINPTTQQASINPSLNDPTRINQTKVQAAVDGWNNLVNTVIPTTNLRTTQKDRVTQSVEWTGNLATDYRFSRGPLRGLRAGIGVNYRGGQVVGNRGGDTIVDPSNPANAIDDPTVDALTPLISPGYYKTTANFSYTYRLKESRRFVPKTIQFDLAIDNVLNRKKPVYGFTSGAQNTGATVFIPRNGSLSDPSRYTVPGNFGYLVPRNYTFSARLSY
jgi:outer membrane receptor for ferric coprogen and ferric-rhodotorulic acid